MNTFISLAFLAASLINLAPMVGLRPDQLSRLYGVQIADADVQLLMQHRALLFGIVGGWLLAAVFVPSLRTAAAAAGLVSMGGFVVQSWLSGTSNPLLLRIAWIDCAAFVLLLTGAAMHLFVAASSTEA